MFMTDGLCFMALSFKLWLIPLGMTASVTDKMSRCHYFQECSRAIRCVSVYLIHLNLILQLCLLGATTQLSLGLGRTVVEQGG